MLEAKVIFTLEGEDIIIQCSKEDKMKDICQKYLIKIEIVYDIILSEKQEFFILSADVECPDNKWTNKQIARTIASSFPYKGLVCVQYKNYMMISAFLSDENSKNNGRKVINRQVCTCEFDINELDPAVVRLFTTIEELVQTGNYTLLDFEKMCFNIVEECREEKFRDPDAITYEVYKKRMQQDEKTRLSDMA